MIFYFSIDRSLDQRDLIVPVPHVVLLSVFCVMVAIPQSPSWCKKAAHYMECSTCRYKVVSERRALQFDSLASDEFVDTPNTDTDHNESDENMSSGALAQDPNSRIFCLYDVERLNSSVCTNEVCSK